MDAKRSNNAIWKLVVPSDATPHRRLEVVLDTYAELVAKEDNYKPLVNVPLDQSVPGVQLDLYVRPSYSSGLAPFINDYLQEPDDANKFHIRGADVCLFLATPSFLYAITSGGGHHIIANFVDYSFPFDTAKKLISNRFRAADVRDMVGSRTSRSETFRRTYSIDRSEAVDKVWKKLVGKLNAELLPEDSPLRELINPDKPPAVEVKSSLVLRQKLDLQGVGTLLEALEVLPEPTAEHLRELSFLDNLYPVKNDPDLTEALARQFVENIRQTMLQDMLPDVDLLDPAEITKFNAGFGFVLSYVSLGDSAPDFEAILPALRSKLSGCLEAKRAFFDEFSQLSLSYRIDPDDNSRKVRRKLLDFLHGQVDLDDKTYFRIDKVWYRCLGDFLENLKNDFISEVFESAEPILLGWEVSFLSWDGGSEGEFNKRQAEEPNFYFGDEVFAKTDRGQVELFDLLKVDDQNKILYIIHAKDSFGAKMRDAASQILISADVISHDIENGKKVLKKYYREEWSRHDPNLGISEAKFLSWFEYDRVYVVLCSTKQRFVAADFKKNRLNSHIARREILSAKNEMKQHGRAFRLAHTRHTS